MRYVNGDDLDQDPYTFFSAQRDCNNGDVGTSIDSELLEIYRAIVPAATAAPPMSQEVKEIDWEAAMRGEKALGLKLTIDEKLLSLLNGPKAAQNNPDSDSSISFSALSIQIGSWKRDSRSELLAKCNFKKEKLGWELLNRKLQLKFKMEFSWSDIAKMEIYVPLNGPGYLIIKLNKSPLFFIEYDPEPKKHTKWRTYTDFTGKQASTLHIHMLKFKPGVLEKYYHKLLIVDPRYNSNTQPCRDLVCQDSEALCPTANILRFDESQRPTLPKDHAESDPASYVDSNFTNHYIGGGINPDYPVHFDPLLPSAALRSDFGHLIDTSDLRLDASRPYPMDDDQLDDQALFSMLSALEVPNQDLSYVQPHHHPSMNPPMADTLQGLPSFVPDNESSSNDVGHQRRNGHLNDLFDFHPRS